MECSAGADGSIRAVLTEQEFKEVTGAGIDCGEAVLALCNAFAAMVAGAMAAEGAMPGRLSVRADSVEGGIAVTATPEEGPTQETPGPPGGDGIDAPGPAQYAVEWEGRPHACLGIFFRSAADAMALAGFFRRRLPHLSCDILVTGRGGPAVLAMVPAGNFRDIEALSIAMGDQDGASASLLTRAGIAHVLEHGHAALCGGALLALEKASGGSGPS